MANPEHLAILKQGVAVWNEWQAKATERADLHKADLRGASLRDANFSGEDLSEANFSGADLRDANLKNANLSEANLSKANLRAADLTHAYLNDANLDGTSVCGADLRGAYLTRTNLSGADLSGADLSGANLWGAGLSKANLSGANVRGVDFSGADLSGADLSGADLSGAHLGGADLSKANLMSAILLRTNLKGTNLDRTNLTDVALGNTVFADVDLRNTQGIESAGHYFPSTIGIDTLYKSRGQIPETFLRGCGVPDSFITQAKALIGAEEGIQFYSCFISYSTKDEEFARRLHARLQQEHIRVWFAPHDMKSGEKLHEQIDEAIKLYDKLLILLSPDSLQSNWVMTELRKARKAERKTGKRKLFPMRLVDYPTLTDWECFDSDTGTDLATEVREYFIPDFSHWKDHDAFEAAFARLLKDLRQSAQPAPLS